MNDDIDTLVQRVAIDHWMDAQSLYVLSIGLLKLLGSELHSLQMIYMVGHVRYLQSNLNGGEM